MRRGDFILGVDGRSLAGVNSDIATSGSRARRARPWSWGAAPGHDDSRTVKVERERIEIPVTTAKLVERGGRRLGVVELLSFSSGAHGLLRRQVDKVLGRGAEGLVLDLRGNGGGLLTEAVLVSSIFIEDGRIVSFGAGRAPSVSRTPRATRSTRTSRWLCS